MPVKVQMSLNSELVQMKSEQSTILTQTTFILNLVAVVLRPLGQVGPNVFKIYN